MTIRRRIEIKLIEEALTPYLSNHNLKELAAGNTAMSFTLETLEAQRGTRNLLRASSVSSVRPSVPL